MRTILFVIFVALAFLPGCMSGGGEVTPPMSEIVETKTTTKDGTVTISKIRRAKGAGFKIPSGGSKGDFKGGALSVEDGAVKVEAGGATSSWKVTKNATSPLIILGGLLIVGGVVLGFLVNWKIGAAIAGSGFALIATARFVDEYPWVGGLVILAGLLAGLYIWMMHREGQGHKGEKEAYETAVKALARTGEWLKSNLTTEKWQEYKDQVERIAGDHAEIVRDAVKAAKK